MIKSIFEKFGADVEVDQDDMLDIAADAAQADLEDDDDVRNLIRSVSGLVGRKLDQETEDKLVEIITNGEAPKDMASLLEMMQ